MKVIYEPPTLKLDTTGTMCLACGSRITNMLDGGFEVYRCRQCANPSCILCNRILEGADKTRADKVCSGCQAYREREEFQKSWATKSVGEKLAMCGLPKLKILAKKKGVKGFSTMTKRDLLQTLTPLTKDSDFPIKET
jgi:hypothetical protein